MTRTLDEIGDSLRKMPAARKTKPAAVTEQQIVERLCGITEVERYEFYRAASFMWIAPGSGEADKGILRIAAMLVKR